MALLTMILGCMFSGKSTELMNQVSRLRAVGASVLVVNHTFDSRQTVITVGPNNMRYPFDTEEAIFRLSSMNDACYTTQRNGKIKPTLVK